jgi:hypothetical protein
MKTEEEKQKYFNFPIQLLENYMTDSEQALKNILHYAVFACAEKLELGTELEKFESSAKYLNVIFKSTKIPLLNGRMLHDSLSPNSPKVGLSTSVFWSYLKEDKTDFEKACLLAFLAIKSIIGNKEYCKTNNALILARMCGRVKSVIDDSEISEEIYFFSNRYQLTKIINELKCNWGLVYYSRHIRGSYVSLKIDFESLVRIAENARETTKLKQAKALENDIVKKVKDSMKKAAP